MPLSQKLNFAPRGRADSIAAARKEDRPMKPRIVPQLRLVLLATALGAGVAVLGATEWATCPAWAQLPAPRLPAPGSPAARALRMRAGELDPDLSRVYIFVDKTG